MAIIVGAFGILWLFAVVGFIEGQSNLGPFILGFPIGLIVAVILTNRILK